ncbi:hypothetical protein [Cellulomonas hominis]
MAGIEADAAHVYLRERSRAGRDGGALAAIVSTGKGRGGSIVHSAHSIYLALLHEIHHEAPDNGVWLNKRILAFTASVSDDTVTEVMAYLAQQGLAFEWRSPRMRPGTKTSCWWVVDVVHEEKELDSWRRLREANLAKAESADLDDLRIHARVSAEVEAARREFVTRWPGHFPTNGRILALLTGAQPVIGTPRAKAVAGMRETKAAALADLTAHGVPHAEAILGAWLTHRKAEGRPVSAARLRWLLDEGQLARMIQTFQKAAA